MNKILTAIALTIALPAVAHAQTAPASAPKADCCEKMKEHSETSHAGRHDVSDAGKECCCKDMAKKDHGAKGGADAHAGHDKSGADSHQNHQQ
jgi:hypothetical protein